MDVDVPNAATGVIDVVAPGGTALLEPGPETPVEPVVRIELLSDEKAAEPTSHYDRKWIKIAGVGARIARVTVEPPDPARLAALLGDNVLLDDDGCTVLSAISGTVRSTSSKVWVEKSLQISGHVDFSTGNIDFPGDVMIRGNVVDLFHVESGGSIEINGAIEAAEVNAAADLVVRGGIAGRDKARCTAGGTLVARYIANASVEAVGDIVVQTEIASSRVVTGAMLRVQRGPLIGGHTTATAGAELQQLGAETGAATLIEIAIDESLRRACIEEIPKLQTQLQRIDKTRQTIQPLLKNHRALSAQQREHATELLFNADELETETRRSIEQLQQSAAKAAEKSAATIVVNRAVHSGVIVRIGDVEAIVPQAFKGPLSIARQRLDNETYIVLKRGGQTIKLRSRPYQDAATRALAQLIAPQKRAA